MMKFSQWTATFQLLLARGRFYRETFPHPSRHPVLMDLARFCYAAKSTFHEDPYEHSRREGRKEVWLRIQEQLRLSPEQMFVLYNHPSVVKTYLEDNNG